MVAAVSLVEIEQVEEVAMAGMFDGM